MNILEALSVRIPCTACERFYEVPLTDILLSHQMLAQGCPVHDETECPPVFQIRLIPRDVLNDFVKAWQQLEVASTGTMASLYLTIADKEAFSSARLLRRAGHRFMARRRAVVDPGSRDRREIEAWTRR